MWMRCACLLRIMASWCTTLCHKHRAARIWRLFTLCDQPYLCSVTKSYFKMSAHNLRQLQRRCPTHPSSHRA
jgi:hypothetical protein